MQTKIYKPLIDKLYFALAIPTMAIVIIPAVIGAIYDLTTLFITVPICLFVAWFLVSPLFGYVELKEDRILIKYGIILKREIRYSDVREIKKDKKFYSYSMLSLKCSFEHLDIKYNRFDVTTVSVIDNDGFIKEIEKRMN